VPKSSFWGPKSFSGAEIDPEFDLGLEKWLERWFKKGFKGVEIGV